MKFIWPLVAKPEVLLHCVTDWAASQDLGLDNGALRTKHLLHHQQHKDRCWSWHSCASACRWCGHARFLWGVPECGECAASSLWCRRDDRLQFCLQHPDTEVHEELAAAWWWHIEEDSGNGQCRWVHRDLQRLLETGCLGGKGIGCKIVDFYVACGEDSQLKTVLWCVFWGVGGWGVTCNENKGLGIVGFLWCVSEDFRLGIVGFLWCVLKTLGWGLYFVLWCVVKTLGWGLFVFWGVCVGGGGCTEDFRLGTVVYLWCVLKTWGWGLCVFYDVYWRLEAGDCVFFMMCTEDLRLGIMGFLWCVSEDLRLWIMGFLWCVLKTLGWGFDMIFF